MTKLAKLASLIAVVAAIVLLAGTISSRANTTACIDDDGCDLVANSAVLNSASYSKGAAWAGPNDESTMNGSGFFGPATVTDDVFADYGSFFEVDTTNLYASFKSFRIDHPTDPANRIMNHWSVESDELKNIYDGVAVLGDNGDLWVTMPKWFESLNTDFRYQLTAVGAPGSNLYVADELTKGQFRIAGGTAGLKVSWQVTGVRHDASALKHATQVEEDKKPEDRGRYIDPTAFGQPQELRLGSSRIPRPSPTAATPKKAATNRDENFLTACLRGQVLPGRAVTASVGLVGLALAFGGVAARRRREER